MSAPNNEPNKYHKLVGSVTTGIAIDIGLGGLVLLNIAASYAREYSFSEEPRRATFISLAMFGLAILGLFFGVRLVTRGGTTDNVYMYIALSILFSIVACPIIVFLLYIILIGISGLEI